MELLYTNQSPQTSQGKALPPRHQPPSIFTDRSCYASTTTTRQDPGSPRTIENDELSIINIISSLLASSQWSEAGESQTLPFDQWEFPQAKTALFFQDLLTGPKSAELVKVIHQLLQGEDPVLKVVASDNVEDIISRISSWNFDLATLRQLAASASRPVMTAVQYKLDYRGWPSNIQMDTEYFRGSILRLDNQDGVQMARDQRGLVMGGYTLPSQNGLPVEVRITHIPSNYQEDFSLLDLVAEHRQGRFTPIPGEEMSGFKVYGFKVPLTNQCLNRILGVHNHNREIIACQADGVIQVDKNTALRAECRSLVVGADRCCEEIRPKSHYQFYEMIYERPWFHNLVEVLVAGEVHLAAMASNRHIVR